MERIAVIMGKMHSGGKKNLVMEYYRHIDKSKIQFDFICDSDSNAIPTEEIEDMGGRVYVISPYQNIIKNMHEMYNIIKRNNYKIVHGYNNTMNVFAMFVAKIANVPIRINESISMGADKGDWKNNIKKMLRPFSKLFSNVYMANGETCGRWQFGDKIYEKDKVKIFKTIINTESNGYSKELRDNTRKKYGITEDCIVIGHIGRLTEQKNSVFLIDIFNEIVKKNSNARLILVGDGNLKKQVLKRISSYGISDYVIYLGRTEKIYELYNAMDVFLLPSLYEGLPVVGIEAQCTGLPVFFSDAVPKESSPCDDLGFFISLKNNAEEWADIILTNTIELAKNRRERKAELKRYGFDSDTEANKLGEYYLELVGKKYV